MIEFFLGFITGALFWIFVLIITIYLEAKKSKLSLTKAIEKTDLYVARKGKRSKVRPVIIPLKSDRVEAQDEITHRNMKEGHATPIEDIT